MRRGIRWVGVIGLLLAVLGSTQSAFAQGFHLAFTPKRGALLPAGIEFIDQMLSLNRELEFQTGTLAIQRSFYIAPPTLTFIGASTVSDAITSYVAGAPVKGTNATLTRTHAMYIDAGAVAGATNAYGLTVNAPTGGTNNYAATFLGGNVGVGPVAPLARFHLKVGSTYDSLLIEESASNRQLRLVAPNATSGYAHFRTVYTGAGFIWEANPSADGSTFVERMKIDSAGLVSVVSLKTTGSAGTKKVVCVDTSTGALYASSTSTGCDN